MTKKPKKVDARPVAKSGAYAAAGATRAQVAATRLQLAACIAYRGAGGQVSFTTDPAWVLDVAINRKAGWPDDPSHSRGSARPLPDGRYPPRADGSNYMAVWRVARTMQQHPRVRIHPTGDRRVDARLIAAGRLEPRGA